jgi:hypothetical protein
MTEYEKLCYILNDSFLSEHQDEMVEYKGSGKPQKVLIDNGKRTITRSLYRFDLDKFDLVPFFNNKEGTPAGLRKFCDYILIAYFKSITYVLLIEMKRGDTSSAPKQLNASETFIRYLYQTAERLHKDFSDTFTLFDKNKIKLRKIVIKQSKSNKNGTQGEKKIDIKADPIVYQSSGQFLLPKFLH